MGRLCSTCGDGNRWLPVAVDTLRAILGRLVSTSDRVPHASGLRNNLAYSLQYLQFLDFSLTDLRLTMVLHTQTIKTFVIVGISVVEGLLYYVLREKGLHRTNVWQSLRTVATNEFVADGKSMKIENQLYFKLHEPVEEEMSLDAMLKKVESKLLLGEDRELYKRLNYLRKLRNKVHLQLVERDLDTDWHNFNTKELNLIKSVLHAILAGPLIGLSDEERMLLAFLHVTEP